MPRPLKPTALKRLAGNPGHRRLNESEPKFTLSSTRAPRHLSAEGRREWRRLAPALAQMGLLDDGARATLDCYCQAWADLLDAEAHIKAEGSVMVSSTGYQYCSPWVTLRKQAREDLRRFGSLFGLDPANRQRVKADAGARQPTLAELLFAGIDEVEDGQEDPE